MLSRRAVLLSGALLTLWPGWPPVLRARQACDCKRVVHIDLDYLYDSDASQVGRNLEVLVARVASIGANTVFLQAFADPLGDGLIRQLYFPNRHLPIRADLFGSVATRLRNQLGVAVYAWMPVLGYALDATFERVVRVDAKSLTHPPMTDPNQYLRLSPFSKRVRETVSEIYEDLARSSDFDGVLFHDDALLSDYEDVSESALAAYAQAGLPSTVQELRSDLAMLQRWTRYKSKAINDFTLQLSGCVQTVKGRPIKTARNIYALPVLSPESETWFAQNLDAFLVIYDWTAVMAMPLMEGVRPEASEAWLERLVDKVAEKQNGLARTIFELQARDWSLPGQPHIEEQMLASWITTLYKRGARHFGYYPDDFIRGRPNVQVIAPLMRHE
ncbi:poly-beta-1,6-N-acetyl-D-glucosamine N-deacetylase PgaB [Pusillimonas minor]|uniref:Poly-beta-1,6-N-acetyl-D-glucosamine N-deacetylase PgaB n=1 Tax=Pusillimonas minor TaxID=2697024 RepID=A0A842HNH4_9BURK|nr:poly-beta-1,6-N-acetyl-D-glucosamine N-deacetylase PgaB [Pusillimonas minor]MBC2768821.1 poly-beta-1,6-N-acetyl-D-glucosamine N-deacetylase PgaB [Pusillimonas minor]